MGSKVKKYPATDFFEGGHLLLAQAIAAGNLADVNKLARTVDLNQLGRKDMSILFFAFQEAMDEKPVQLQILRDLVKLGADPTKPSPSANGATVVYTSMFAKSTKFVEALLDGGMNPDSTRGSTPLIFDAATEGSFETLKLLLARGANINKRDSLGQTAIFVSTGSYQLDQTVYLLENGADPKVVDNMGISFAYSLSFLIQRQQHDPKTLRKLSEIRELAISKGMKWPPDEPVIERDRMRARGEKPVVPRGQSK